MFVDLFAKHLCIYVYIYDVYLCIIKIDFLQFILHRFSI